VSEKKAKGSELEGDANIMIFPNLDAANIGYKIAERIGGARAIGPILQGLSKPANDLSRGCSVDDIYDLMAVTAAQVK
jgi:phosphate acetyltransferase